MSDVPGPVALAVQAALADLDPVYLEVVNESGNHSVPAGSESHFRVTLVSSLFVGQRLVARHQRLYAALADLLAGPIHALALHTYSPDEWLARGGRITESPDCLGGSKGELG